VCVGLCVCVCVYGINIYIHAQRLEAIRKFVGKDATADSDTSSAP